MAAHRNPTPVMPCALSNYGAIKYNDAMALEKQPEWFPPTSGIDKGLKVRNSLTSSQNATDAFIPSNGNKVLWYTCGPTVYDSCHMGHARAYLTFDILRRITEDYFKYDLLYHVNVTDVDDKIILRARRNHLVAEYRKENPSMDAVCKKVDEAVALKQGELDAEAVKLAEPLPADAISMLVKERKEQLDILELKKGQFAEAVAKINKTKEAKNVQDIISAAAGELGALIDKEKGHTITDHSVFNAHSRKYEKEYFEDMAALGVKEPDVLTRVTEYIPQIVEFIGKIVEKGLAYESNGSVYLSIEDFKKAGHSYRKLRPGADTTDAEMAEGEGALGGEEQEKRHKNDFALWKKSKAGEPFWSSPWGEGRPGWHIECSVVAGDILGPVMDVHAGGVDLKFPHHDNELAQSEACYGHGQWVNYFFHAGHLQIKGLKMSKSLKNFVTIRQALKDFTAREIRMMFLLQVWWKEMNFSDQTMDDAKAKDKAFKEFFHKAKHYQRSAWADAEVGWDTTGKNRDRELQKLLFETQGEVDAAFRNNYDTPTAILAMLKLVSAFNVYEKETERVAVHLVQKIAGYITSIFRVLGLVANGDELGYGQEGGASGAEQVLPPFIDVLVDYRTEVRNAARSKDDDALKKILAASDKVRTQLPPLGVRVDDVDDKSLWKLDDPAVLMKEDAERAAAAAAKAKQKLENACGKKEQALKKLKDVVAIGEPVEMFKGRFAGHQFGEDGLPTTTPEGEAVAKSALKKLQKEKSNQEKAWKDLSEKANGDVAAYVKGLEDEIADIKKQLAA